MARLSRVVIAFDMAQEHHERLQREFPDVEFTVCADQDRLPEELAEAEVLVGVGISPELLSQCPDLRWVQTTGAGVDRMLFPDLIDSDVIVTNFSGVQASNIAEHILAMMLAFARGLPDLIRRQVHGEWTQPPPDQHPRPPQSEFYGPRTFELGYQTLAIAGLGDIGHALAVRANALGMRVIGTRRHTGEALEPVKRLYGP